MTKDEALKLALEALDDMHIVDFPLEDLRNWNKAINAIKEALAQPTSGDYALGYAEGFNDACKRQPERLWVGLTDADKQIFAAAQHGWEDLLTAADAKLKEKNT